MNSKNEQRTSQEERTPTREKREGNKKEKTILDHLISRSRARSEGSIDILNKRRRNKEEDRIEAEREFLGKFEKVRKITRVSLERKTHYKEEKESITETEGSAKEDRNMMEEDIRTIKEFMKDIREELKNAMGETKAIKDEWRRKEEKWERIKERERERREKRNNIVIKRWEMSKRESLESAVEEMLKNKFNVEVIVVNERRTLQVNEKKFVWKEKEGLKEQNFWSRQSSKKETEKQKRDKTQEQRHRNTGKEYKKKDENERNKNIEINTETRKLTIGFWNVAGLDNKDAQFWEYIKKFDIIGMVETWIEEKCWYKSKEQKNKEKAIRGIITGVKKNIEEENRTEIKEKRTEGIYIRRDNYKKK
ncbi:hypothetical protein P5V15_002462 [Pogonomyrmex californicus]